MAVSAALNNFGEAQQLRFVVDNQAVVTTALRERNFRASLASEGMAQHLPGIRREAGHLDNDQESAKGASQAHPALDRLACQCAC
eukprot:5238615-Amphidinium_carterae.1